MSSQVITKDLVQKGFVQPNATTATQTDPYQDRLLKLIPAEVVSVYLALLVLVSGKDANKHEMLQLGIVIILLVVNILYKRNADVTDWKQLAISSVAFVIWVLTLGGPLIEDRLILGEKLSLIGAILTPLFTLVAPLIYK
ncbi:hypothetical protein [Mucilaginibacter sp.]|uniref:hypothetical protein n=1 Tax=Mucilaginibacter sp. TaxID=1882438 RepID=UPI0032654848